MIEWSESQLMIRAAVRRFVEAEIAPNVEALFMTNIDVADSTRTRFGEFYAALYDATLAKNAGSVVTEYSLLDRPVVFLDVPKILKRVVKRGGLLDLDGLDGFPPALGEDARS